MKIGAIIAEYNPFHNGHKYQINKFKKESNLDYIIVIMSGNFTQRGEPAWMPKHLRAKMALLGGADLVIELPLYYATGNASLFAQGAISHLNALGCVNELCFGCETDQLTSLMSRLENISNILINEPEDFKRLLSVYLKKGLSFPAARESALKSYFCDCSDFFMPNNILALEYMIALKKSNSSIKPKPIIRNGPGYHDLNSEHCYASASAIRKQLATKIPDSIQGLPLESLQIIKDNFYYNMPIVMNDFSSVFAGMQLLSKNKLNQYLDVNDDIANLMYKNLDSFTDIESFILKTKNKSLTHTRLSRCVTHVLTKQHKESFDKSTQNGYAHYARILGFKKASSPLLNKIKVSTSIPMITKLSTYKQVLDQNGQAMLEMDIQASNLYRTIAQIKYNHPLKNEFTENLVII